MTWTSTLSKWIKSNMVRIRYLIIEAIEKIKEPANKNLSINFHDNFKNTQMSSVYLSGTKCSNTLTGSVSTEIKSSPSTQEKL